MASDPTNFDMVLFAGPISQTCTKYLDFVEIFNISLDLSTIYFAKFYWVLSFLCVLLSLCPRIL